MTFRQIGIPARKVIDRIESERAAVKVAQGIRDGEAPLGGDASPVLPVIGRMNGDPAGREDRAGSPRAAAPARSGVAQAQTGGKPSSYGVVKKTDAETPASLTGPRQREVETEQPYNRRRIAPELRLIAINDARGHPHAAKRVPARSPRVSLSVIEGGLHAVSPMRTRFG